MIENINLTRLRNTEHLQFMNDILEVVQLPSFQCEVQVRQLYPILSEIGEILENDPATALTDELAALDDIRDDLIIGLVKFCDAYSYYPENDKRAAGIALTHSLESYGTSIASQSYSAESASITNILSEWSAKPELRAAALLTGAGVWTQALETANDNFKAKYRQRADKLPHLTHDALKAKWHEANRAYHELRDRVDSFYTINNLSGPWEDAIAKMNVVIHHYNEVLRSRERSLTDASSFAMSSN